ncbi:MULTISPECIES: ATP/GTP-binding protein [unclassified Streptomyces]|uniref:ATP/GTP-binding protein n=1 Tax=unclassified Streptomyces TaxID=2593676 RepID=UPI001BE77886|nr:MULTISPECIES: ATP/GTP-binding protein [unclassified Streptomyces]MBT2405577.1 ATP/GTP-binding protein [Streptomyces sp. ISL-21]MBT2607743.1 ATP/GTP-binding protein [Streptomyces sp. ISL-87]
MTDLLDLAPLSPMHQTVRRPLYTETTTSQALYLPIAPPTLGTAGAIIGRELYSGKAFIYCPFSAFGDGLPGGNMIVMGDTGRGKSALTKTYTARQIRLGRQVVVLDTKEQKEREEGEWAALGRSLTGKAPVKFAPGGGRGASCINPMDPAIAGKRQIELVRTIVELGLGKPLDEFAGSALRIAIRRAHQRAADLGRTPVLADVAAALRSPEESDATAKQRTRDELLGDGLEASYVLDRLCGSEQDATGDLTGMLDGPTSLGVDLDADMIVFDLTKVPSGGVAMTILVAVISVFLEEVWLRPLCECGTEPSQHERVVVDANSGAWELGPNPESRCRRYTQRKRILVCEEAWHILGTPQLASLLEKFLKFARGYGLSCIFIVHHLSDIDDSPETQAALKMADTIVIYSQKKSEAEATVARLGLPSWTAEHIMRLRRGIALWKVGEIIYPGVQHLLVEAEQHLCFSSGSMTDLTSTSPEAK